MDNYPVLSFKFYKIIALVQAGEEGGGRYITIQLHKTKINRKTKINQGKKRLYQFILLKITYI